MHIKLVLIGALALTLTACSSRPSYQAQKNEAHNKFAQELRKAKQGDADTIWSVAQAYKNGKNWYYWSSGYDSHKYQLFPADYAKSVYWFEKLYDTGGPYALRDILGLYQGKLANPTKVEQWLEKGAQSDLASNRTTVAQHYLGQQQYAKALSLYQGACQLNQGKISASACESAALLLRNPKGHAEIQTDYAAALAHYQKALQLDDYKPFYVIHRNIATLHLEGGHGLSANPLKAKRLFKQYYDAYLAYCKKDSDKVRDGQCKKIEAKQQATQRKVQDALMFEADRALPRNLREDKYKMGLAQSLKQENYPRALLYFKFLDRMKTPLPTSMHFFRAEALYHTDQLTTARQSLLSYIEKAGKQGRYYKKALALLTQIDEKAVN